jgi:hypothetical protein
LNWKLLQTVTGKTQVSLPSEFRQIIVEVCHTPSKVVYNFIICKMQLTDILRVYVQGQHTSGNNNYCRISATKENVVLNTYYRDGIDVSSESSLTVYYI